MISLNLTSKKIIMKKIFTFILLTAVIRANAQPCIPNTNSVQFDGSSSYVAISPQTGLDITTTLTIEAWIKPDAFGFNSAQNSIVCKHGWSSGEGGFVLRCGGTGELSFNIGGVDTNGVNVSWIEIISPTSVLSLNTWAHVAGTFDGHELKCYVNGNLEGTTPFIGTIAPSTSYPLALGRLADPVYGPDRYFSGLMDEVRVWNRALTQTELQAGMNNHIDPTSVTGLVSYWRMNEGANATLYDVAGTNNGGTIFCTWNTSVPFNAFPPEPLITYNGGTLYSSAPTDNQWYLGGTAIAGETQSSYTPTQNGVYTVEVTSPEGCTTMSAQFTVIDVGVEELSGIAHTSVYPNPFHEQAFVVLTNNRSTGIANLSVADLQGRKVMDINGIELTEPVTKICIDRKNLSDGIYFYEWRSAGAVISKGKLAVQ
jgi:hypothetical protein